MVAIVGLFLISPGGDSISYGNGSWQINSSISSERLDKSQGSRFSIWTDAWNAFSKSPLGVGPDGVHQRQIAIINGHPLEIHNDALGYLVERGVLGFIGFIGFWVVIWRAAASAAWPGCSSWARSCRACSARRSTTGTCG